MDFVKVVKTMKGINLLNVDKRKGQYFSFDAIIGSVIFILALVSMLSYWHSLRTSISSQAQDLASAGTQLSESMFTPGYPAGAPCEQMEQLGVSMSWTDKRINKTKLDCLGRLDEEQLRNKTATPFNMTIIFNDKVVAGPELSLLKTKNMAKTRRIVTVLDDKDRETLGYLDIYVYR